MTCQLLAACSEVSTVLCCFIKVQWDTEETLMVLDLVLFAVLLVRLAFVSNYRCFLESFSRQRTQAIHKVLAPGKAGSYCYVYIYM